jgi:D-glycero-alpha-D-manno-heptose-7-phosphate kinase
MIVVQTPLRVSFLGGGTDFEDFYCKEEGAVLSTAINLSVYIIVKERYDGYIYINYSRKEIVDSIDKLEHELAREALRLTGVKGGIEITTLADVTSEGSGLGSSSSFTVGMLHALYAYKGELPTAERLADEACQIEINKLARPIGKQDQYIAAYGNLRFIRFNGSISAERVELPRDVKQRLNRNLMLFYTGKSRKSATVLGSQKNNIESRRGELAEMRKLAYEAKDCLCRGDLDDFGEILHRGWEFKKRLTDKVSNVDIDEMYSRAREAGAIGGKICGAGGGGFLLLYCRPEKQEDVRRTLSYLTEYTFSLKEDGSKVIFNYQG